MVKVVIIVDLLHIDAGLSDSRRLDLDHRESENGSRPR